VNHVIKPFEQRLKEAIRRAGKTEAERAARIGRTSRAIDDWEKGRGIAPLLKNLEIAGVIRILDDDSIGACPSVTGSNLLIEPLTPINGT
jgi:hypothetical protein